MKVADLFKYFLLSNSTHQSHINNFDALRGWAALLVVIAHMPGIKQPSLGASGVWLFFVLSGFLLFWFFEKKDLKNLLLTTPNYFWRRFFRLIPAYFFCIIIYAIAYTFLYDSLMFGWMVRHLFFAEAEGHFWSVKVELIFYFILPFSLIAILLSSSYIYKLIVSFLMIGVVYYIFEYKTVLRVNAASIQLAPYMSPFYLGIILSLIRDRLPERLFDLLFYIGALGLLLMSLDFSWLLSIRSILPYEEVDNIGWRYPYLIYPFAGLMVLGAYKSKTPLLQNKLMLSIGICAYSFYLWHILPINILKTVTDNILLNFLVTLVVSYILAVLTYRWVEKPCIELSKRYQLQIIKK